jgi:methionyl-tRNA synthetase
VDGRCPNHPNMDLVEIEEENYFFKLSNYKNKLKSYLNSGSVIPDWRGEEAKNIASALEDFSISRDKSRLPWGVPVPGDDSQVMYVWFDALTSYISTLGWPSDPEGDYEKFWNNGNTLQLAGKDQVKFQSVIWQAMLMSAGLKNTDLIFYHGFINSGGQKMSKSLGNVIAPSILVAEYGRDAVRYYLARHISTFEDGDITPESFKEAYNANLANGIGNLTSRIMKMAGDNLEKPVEPDAKTIPDDFISAMDSLELGKAINIIWEKIGALDGKIQSTEPFKLVKSDPEAGKKIIKELALELYTIGRMLNPFMPETSTRIKELVKANKKPEAPLFQRKD